MFPLTDPLSAIIFEHCSDAAICLAPDGRIIAWNPAAASLFEYPADQAIGKPISTILQKPHAQTISQMCAQAQNGNHILLRELSVQTHSGKPLHIQISCTPLYADNGSLMQMLLLCRNIVHIKEIEEKLKTQQQQLIQSAKMAALGTLVAGIAHEMNNPLNLMLLHNTLLQKIWNDMKPFIAEKAATTPDMQLAGLSYNYLMTHVDQHFADSNKAISRMLNLINSLKQFSRKSYSDERAPLDVNECITNAVNLAATTMRKASIQLTLSLGDQLPKITANAGHIEQVLLNLIINAIQAIDHDAGRITIRSAARADNTLVCIEVEDNGCGIDPAIQHNIFDPFVTSRQTTGGTGLGLSIAYNLIHEHGGKIEFTSKQAVGTTFRILLPTVFHKKPVKVLIADDEISMRASLEKALSRSKRFIIESAASGYEACIKLGTFKPDILILDLIMPEMNGFEVCKLIRSEPALSSMEVVIMTGYVKSELLDGIRGLGFTDIVTKPFKIVDMVKRIEEKADKF
ncbi:MAG: ATP-binding protein [Desulfobacterota bacterium]|nr:ATP-binding protein [Thermodesulfobacteriota bacterium]